MIALYIVGGLLGLIVVWVVCISFLPILKVAPQPVDTNPVGSPAPPCREDVRFTVEGAQVAGWLYLPETRSGEVPCVVMSTGFGGTKDFILEPYALRFVDEGYAVLSYDFRHYGESEGEPRQLYCAPYQLDDLREAVRFARGHEAVDAEKIVLWGTSAAGQYGVILAAEDGDIAGVIAQCAAFDHKEDSKQYLAREGWWFFIKLLFHAARDKGRSRFGLSPHVFPAYGRPGTVSMLNAPGAFEGIARLARGSQHFRNEACARMAFMPHGPDPLELAPRVKCPVQILVCEKDEIVSPISHVRVASRLGEKATVLGYPVTHFELYEGEHFARVMADQLAFIDGLFAGNSI